MRKRQRETDLKENSFWVGSLASLDFNGVDPQLLIQYPALVDSLTVDVVQQSAQKYFNMDRYVRVVLYPEEGEESEEEERYAESYILSPSAQAVLTGSAAALAFL